ncbi:hypothetical protein [Pallidibacillus pasinlerensis]|uniref:Uncharacterized protein n=1 Tax=Pallidibacillus pasinlerensis TaxID=2703818 RepID=A0ABX0A5K4_9BACI|nr:hypothetical protein [Pallidibacillus pasinlerensis]NCU17249.1 hypothetical protein [Pallidibacillus pasinlerensis]
MFDPTAYENIKVVFEGIVYDYDLNGDIAIIERNDLINLADMSRIYNLTFINKNDRQKLITMRIELQANFQQLVAELYPMKVDPGANITIHFFVNTKIDEVLEKRISKFLKKQYEKQYEFEQITNLYQDQRITYNFILKKHEDITENNIEDLHVIVTETINYGEQILTML